jgi:hypothetical protein
VIVTEFGWPKGPEGGSEINCKTGQHCGIASKKIKYRFINTYRLIEYRSTVAIKLDYIYYCGY